MSYNSPKKSVQVSVNSDVNDCTPCNVVLNQCGGSCEVLNLSVYDAHDALNWDGQGSISHVDNEGSLTLDEAIPLARGRGRPPKSRKRGRPKGSSMHTRPKGSSMHTNPSSEFTRNIGRPRKQRQKSHAGGKPSTSASPYEEASGDDDDNDEHASEGEGVECGNDDALEADGPVLDDSPEADCEFVDVVPPKWRSGDKMEQDPLGTFWPLPAFNGLVGPDLGHVPREFSKFHLFLMLFLLDLIDHIINETNMYANLQRGRCSSLHEPMRRWVPLDRHSFLRFLGMALGMALNYMPSKQHYWKDDMRGSLHFPNFGDKMSHTSFQQIKRCFGHMLDMPGVFWFCQMFCQVFCQVLCQILPDVLPDFAGYSNARSFLSDVLFAFLSDVLFARCYVRFCQLFSCQDYGCMVVQLPGLWMYGGSIVARRSIVKC
ncbi:hypothetical protein L7F22_057862 [Adiantum nelumboides]|nr:hypothetical protein [Adiantum nelumboides]